MWAIMLTFSNDDQMLVTEDTGHCDWNLKPMLFSTKEEAEKRASIFRIRGREENVKVIYYEGQWDV